MAPDSPEQHTQAEDGQDEDGDSTDKRVRRQHEQEDDAEEEAQKGTRLPKTPADFRVVASGGVHESLSHPVQVMAGQQPSGRAGTDAERGGYGAQTGKYAAELCGAAKRQDEPASVRFAIPSHRFRSLPGAFIAI